MQIDQQHDELVQAVGERCLQHGWMLVCAESCTGGLLSARLTDMPGSSNWFERGYVTYSNTAKVELLRAGQGISTQAVTHTFDGDRSQVRLRAVEFALQKLHWFISQH